MRINLQYPLTFRHVSGLLANELELEDNEKVLLYTSEGHPILFNLDLFQLFLPKLNEDREYYGIVTKTPSNADSIPSDI